MLDVSLWPSSSWPGHTSVHGGSLSINTLLFNLWPFLSLLNEIGQKKWTAMPLGSRPGVLLAPCEDTVAW